MRFLMILKATSESEAGLPPNPQLMAAIAKLSEEAIKRGTLLSSGGLLPSSHGTRISVSGGTTSVIDGPFTETKELAGGYAMFDLASKEEAIRIGREFMQLHADILGPSFDGQLEIRPLMAAPGEPNDCPAHAGFSRSPEPVPVG